MNLNPKIRKLVRLLKFATFYLERYSSGADFMGSIIVRKKIVLRICKRIVRVKNQLFKTLRYLSPKAKELMQRTLLTHLLLFN